MESFYDNEEALIDRKSNFKLKQDFIDTYSKRQPPMEIVGLVTYYRTYSKKIEELGRNEHWFETVRRVVETEFTIQKEHCLKNHLPWKDHKAQKSAQITYDKIFNFKFTPPGRGLSMMNIDFLRKKGGAVLNNCAIISTADILNRKAYPFAWTMENLMFGVGVSADLLGANKIHVKAPSTNNKIKIVIEDSREGWVDSLYNLLNSYFNGTNYLEFDYSVIRPEGSPIKNFGGTSSGYKPLKKLHDSIRVLLDGRVGNKLTAVDIVDIFNYISVCVISGNIRRSAMLTLGNKDDKDFIEMKDPIKHPTECMDRRWASNNSVVAEVGETNYAQFTASIAANGEPGFVWLDTMRKYGRIMDPPDYADMDAVGCNPCGEQTLWNQELCNLVETYPSHHESYEEFKETLKYAYLYAKTVTLVETRCADTNQVMLRNRRIGISQSGIIDAFVKHGRRKMIGWCCDGYTYLRGMDRIYSDWLCIPKSIKITSVKPSGSVSLLANVSPGIHYPHSEYYIRRIRISSSSPLCDILENHGYHWEYEVVGKDEEARRMTKVFEFPCHSEFYDRSKRDVTIWEQIKNCSDYQKYWADNNVSITVTFKEEEEKEIAKTLFAYEDSLKAVTFLKLDNTSYKLMPYEEITKEKYDSMFEKVKPIEFNEINLYQKSEVTEMFCDSSGCEVVRK